jgi:hypothetical protein
MGIAGTDSQFPAPRTFSFDDKPKASAFLWNVKVPLETLTPSAVKRSDDGCRAGKNLMLSLKRESSSGAVLP